MKTPIGKVKSVCTDSELAVVRASRKPELGELSLAEAKRAAARARKLFDKWQGLHRGQSRDQRRRTGRGDLDNRTQLKAEIFAEALQELDARVEKLAAADAKKSASKSKKGPTKRSRATGHRAERAGVRLELKAEKSAIKAQSRDKSKPPATKPSGKAPDSATPAPAKTAEASSAPATSKRPQARKQARPPAAKKPAKSTPARTPIAAEDRSPPIDRLQAATAAKQSRIKRSGLTSRIRGHVSARGRRAQGKRDSKQG